MPIVLSEIASDATQVDGRRRITERHTDQLGNVHESIYFVEAGDDATADLAARAATLSARLNADEIDANLAQVRERGPDAVLTFDQSTQTESIVAMAQRADTLSAWEMVLLTRWLATREPATLTGLIGMSSDQIVFLASAMQSLDLALNTMRAVIAAIAAAAAQQGT